MKSILLITKFGGGGGGGLVEMMFGLVNASFSLPDWQAVKMTFWPPAYATHSTQKKSNFSVNMKLPDCDLEIACNELFQNEDVFKHFLRKDP